jgi:lipopolysaccharide transport system ATP-binding protein
MSLAAIVSDGLGKRYSVRTAPGDTALEAVRKRNHVWQRRVPRSDFWALRDVSFEIGQGELFGVIGANGAGKSTLLKVLARITEPTEGYAEIRGKVGSLLEVGTGFHPDLTGRENVFLNGAVLGMRRAEIRRKFDEIVEFAGVSQFIDVPVKWYSSGMYVRLAFAVAAHLEPEILFVDEVLSVGDLAFQQKCLGRMDELAHGGRTVLFVSHNLAAVSSICERALYLKNGRLEAVGSVREMIDRYVEEVKVLAHTTVGERTDRTGNGRIRFAEIRVGRGGAVATGDDCEVTLTYAGRPGPGRVRVDVAVYGALAESVFHCSNEVSGDAIQHVDEEGEFRLLIKRLPLAPGSYTMNLYCEVDGEIADWVQGAGFLEVIEGDFFGTGRLPSAAHGTIVVDHEWSASENISLEQSRGAAR